jgi:hypothetical protein
VAESFSPGAVVSVVARSAEVCPGQIYRKHPAVPAGCLPLPFISLTAASNGFGRPPDVKARYLRCPVDRDDLELWAQSVWVLVLRCLQRCKRRCDPSRDRLGFSG